MVQDFEFLLQICYNFLNELQFSLYLLQLAREHAEKTSIMLDVAPVSASQSHFTTPSTAEIKSLTPVAHSSPAIVTPVAGVGSSLSVSSPGTDTGTGPSVAEPLAAVDAGSDNPGTAHGHAASADAAPLPM